MADMARWNCQEEAGRGDGLQGFNFSPSNGKVRWTGGDEESGKEEWTLIKVGGNSTPAAAEIVENDASSVWHYGFICCIWSGSTTHPDLVYPPSGRTHTVLVDRMLRVGKDPIFILVCILSW